MGPNVNGFERDLAEFVNGRCPIKSGMAEKEPLDR